MKIAFLENRAVKNILSAVAVAVFGCILLNLTFIFDFLFQTLVDTFVKLFSSADLNMTTSWYPGVKHALFVIIIGILSWFVFRTKLSMLYKAIFLTVPTAVALLTIGIFLLRTPIVAFALGGLLTAGVLYYFYRTKQPWLYYYAVILVGFAMAVVGLTGVEI